MIYRLSYKSFTVKEIQVQVFHLALGMLVNPR